MSRRSSIADLPPDVVAMIDKKLAERRCALREVLEDLQEAGVQVSASALYRHSKSIAKISESLRSKREIADAIARNLTDTPERDVSQVVVEQTHAMLFDIMSAETDELELDEKLKLAGRVSSAINNLAQASKHHADTVLKIRTHAVREAAKVAGVALKEQGISEETVALVRARILGVQPGVKGAA